MWSSFSLLLFFGFNRDVLYAFLWADLDPRATLYGRTRMHLFFYGRLEVPIENDGSVSGGYRATGKY